VVVGVVGVVGVVVGVVDDVVVAPLSITVTLSTNRVRVQKNAQPWLVYVTPIV
jgi:hypothetical protein